jgi:hypothetical protein
MSDALDFYILDENGEPLAEPRAEMVYSFMLPQGAPIMITGPDDFPICGGVGDTRSPRSRRKRSSSFVLNSSD